MYKLVGVDGLGNYAVLDSESSEIEAINESDLKLCLNVGLSVAGAYLNGVGNVEYTEDYFPSQVEFEDDDEDEDDDYYDDYSSDEDYEDDYSDDEDYSDDDDDYSEDDEDYEDDENYEDDDYDDDDYEDEDDGKDFIVEDSTMSKLFSRLSDEQIAILQEYYLYISQRIFDLKTGNAQLTVRKSKDLNELKNTGGTWYYAGFIDMGYKGSSVCLNCRANMSRYAVSSCCETPIITYRGGDSFRTYNGTCDCCGSRCSAVVRKVALREIYRGNQNGVVCGNCNTELEQSSHYCTFNHPVRFMHVAWDVSKTDIEVGLFGQLATKKLEDIIDSNNCIKFGLECIADFFDIPKDSSAFKALKDVQDTCVSDMKGLESTYSNYSDISEVNKDFAILDGYVQVIGAYNTKASFLGDEILLPERLISSYIKMRKAGMVPPKSLIQYIRDYILDWDVHKFTDKSKKFPSLIYSVGSIHGAKANLRSIPKVSHLKLSEVVGKSFGKSANYLAKFIELYMGYDYNFCNSFSFRYDISYFYRLVANYLTVLFTYEICGFYKYNALPSDCPNASSDEGGSSRDEFGKHAVELKTTYDVINKRFFKDFSYDINFFKQLIQLFSIIQKIEDEVKRGSYYSNSMTLNRDTGLYEMSSSRDWNKDVVEKYANQRGISFEDLSNAKVFLENYLNIGEFTFDISRRFRHTDFSEYTIEEFNNKLESYTNLYLSNVDSFKAFQEENLSKAIEKKNKVILEEREAKKTEEKQVEEKKAESNKGIDVSKIKTAKQVVDYLASIDLSAVDSKFDFAKKLVSQLSSSGKEPTQRQYYYIKPLFDELVGASNSQVTQTSNKTLLSDRKDIEEAIDYCLSHTDKLDSERTASILQSIKRMGTISERQMKYAEQALKVFNETRS